MRAAIFAIALTLAPAAAQAEGQPARTICQQVGDLAVTIMTNRQNGDRMSDMMGRLDGMPLAQDMVIDAYGYWEGWDMASRIEAIEDFRAKWELWCYLQTRG